MLNPGSAQPCDKSLHYRAGKVSLPLQAATSALVVPPLISSRRWGTTSRLPGSPCSGTRAPRSTSAGRISARASRRCAASRRTSCSGGTADRGPGRRVRDPYPASRRRQHGGLQHPDGSAPGGVDLVVVVLGQQGQPAGHSGGGDQFQRHPAREQRRVLLRHPLRGRRRCADRPDHRARRPAAAAAWASRPLGRTCERLSGSSSEAAASRRRPAGPRWRPRSRRPRQRSPTRSCRPPACWWPGRATPTLWSCGWRRGRWP